MVAVIYVVLFLLFNLLQYNYSSYFSISYSITNIFLHLQNRESVILLTSSLSAHCERHFSADFIFLIIVGHFLHISGQLPPELQSYLSKYLNKFEKPDILDCASAVSVFMERFVIVSYTNAVIRNFLVKIT